MMVLAVRFLLLTGQVYTYLLMGYAILSWFPGLHRSRLANLVSFLVEPLLTPLRRLGLQIGGLDFTVVVAILGIEFLQRVLISLVT